TEGDRGGQIAYSLTIAENQKIMQDWVYNLQPQALGPLLLALSTPPKPLTVEDDEKENFNEDEVHLLQQQSIERCLGWISSKPDANQQFEEAIIRMNRDGARPEQSGLSYCENKAKLDLFMDERVLGLAEANNAMRSRYRDRVSKLGIRLNKHCDYSTIYTGPAFAPVQGLKAIYKGPNID
ncbi:MAG: hypothetical protein C0490_14195, partial [Marivirga sp.]|nr:hypothetical protein [Marivirga sp.]